MRNDDAQSPAPLVTVIMATYNRERTIRVAIESIRAQSCKNWELIIVDDSSGDATQKIIVEYAAADRRIVLIRNENNQGPFPPLNRALAHARGQFIAINDSDDVMHPRRLELQTRYMQRHAWCGATAARYTVRSWGGAILERHMVPFTPLGLLLHVPLFNVIAHSSLMVRSSIMRQLGGYNTDYRYSADWDLILRICSVTKLRVIARQLEILTHATDNITTTRQSAMDRYGTTVACAYATAIGLDIKTRHRVLFSRVFVWRYHSMTSKLLWYIQTLRYKWHILTALLRRQPYPIGRVRLIGAYVWSSLCSLLV